MALELYAHPFSSYCQKVLIALYENDTPFEFRMLDPQHPQNMTVLQSHWPMGKFPMLLDNGHPVFESTVIIEYLAQHYSGHTALLPDTAIEAAETRLMDRIFDNYVMNNMQAIVSNAMRPDDEKDQTGVDQARTMLEKTYRWLETRLASKAWATGDAFTLADCAAAPALFYADWVHPIPEENKTLRAYRARLLDRPSIKRAVDEARPYRHLFPLGAPDRD